MSKPTEFVALSVNYRRDRAIRRVGPMAELLYIRSLAHARKNRTSGRIEDFDLEEEDLAGCIDDVPGAVDELVSAQLWLVDDDGWVIRSWDKWNGWPGSNSSGDGSRGNHIRWHEKRGVKVEGCRFCYPPPPPPQGRSGDGEGPAIASIASSDPSDSPSDDNTAAGAIATSDRGESLSIATSDRGESPSDDPTSSLQAIKAIRPRSLGESLGSLIREEKRIDRDGDARRRGTRINHDFVVDDDMRRWARDKTPHIDLDTETANFVDYWSAKTGKDATKLDWVATWRTWMRRSEDRLPDWRKRQPPTEETADDWDSTDDLTLLSSTVAQRRAQREWEARHAQ